MTHPNPERILTILETWMGGNAEGLSVGVGEGPETASPAYPYLVLVPLNPFDITGPLNDINSIHNYEFQVASVGLTAQQAEGGKGAARDRMLTTPGPDFTSAGYKATGSVKIEPGPALESEQEEKPSLFISNETYRLMLVPA